MRASEQAIAWMRDQSIEWSNNLVTWASNSRAKTGLHQFTLRGRTGRSVGFICYYNILGIPQRAVDLLLDSYRARSIFHFEVASNQRCFELFQSKIWWRVKATDCVTSVGWLAISASSYLVLGELLIGSCRRTANREGRRAGCTRDSGRGRRWPAPCAASMRTRPRCPGSGRHRPARRPPPAASRSTAPPPCSRLAAGHTDRPSGPRTTRLASRSYPAPAPRRAGKGASWWGDATRSRRTGSDGSRGRRRGRSRSGSGSRLGRDTAAWGRQPAGMWSGSDRQRWRRTDTTVSADRNG